MNSETLARWIEALDSPDWSEREEARTHLLAADAHAVEALIAALRVQRSRRCYEAAEILAQIDDERWIVPMQQALTSSNVVLGQVAAAALQRFGHRVVAAYLEALPHCRLLVQLRIIAALEHIGDRRAVQPLMDMLRQAQSPTLRYTLIQALGVLGDAQTIELIGSFANDEDYHVRERVRVALQRLAASGAGKANGNDTQG